MNENNPATQPGTWSAIAQPVHQPVEPAKMPDAPPPKETVKAQQPAEPAKMPHAAPSKDAVKRTP